jgi:hypothetical protein
MMCVNNKKNNDDDEDDYFAAASAIYLISHFLLKRTCFWSAVATFSFLEMSLLVYFYSQS